MTHAPAEILTVYLDAGEDRRKIRRLALKDRRILFKYDAAFIVSSIEILLIKLSLKPHRFSRHRSG
jgi:serine/threonine-protein kinase HipA